MEGRRHLIVSLTSVTSSKHIIAASEIYHISFYVNWNDDGSRCQSQTLLFWDHQSETKIQYETTLK